MLKCNEREPDARLAPINEMNTVGRHHDVVPVQVAMEH
jgi:hypothetical protein